MSDRRFIFHDIRLAARLAWYDLLSEKILALCLIIGLAATAAPLIILSGLRGGLVEGLRTVLLEDPHVREISSASNRDFTTGWLDRLRKEPDVVFVMPRTRTLAASVLLVPPGRPFAGRRIELIPSHADDPLTTPATMPADESTILLSASAAASLHIQAGDLLELHVTRLGLGPETVRIPLHVQAITPQRALNRDAAFVSLRLAQTVELYREHSLSWSDAWAQAATPAPSYPGFRLYTRQINTIPALDTRLRALPYLLDDPFTTEKAEKKGKSKEVGLNRIYTELATCPVCLDRLDSNISGLFTIACQHTFHADCLSKWKDDSCPVCRHTNKSTHALSGDSVNTLESDEKCKDCEATENLWICLVCGNVGCGRYENKHALKHWEETNHCFSMEINTQRVWDYAEDGYVHRLVQNEVDGKIIELPLRDEGKKTTEEKIDKIGLEYSKLLISQLESQKEYYVAKLKEGTNKVNTLYKSFEKMSDRVTAMEISAREFDSLRDEMRKQQKACVKLQDAMCDMKALNSALIYKVKVMDAEKKKLENEKAELQEQVKDLMFYLESREKFKDASDEVKEGQILMTPAPVRKETKKKSSKGKK